MNNNEPTDADELRLQLMMWTGRYDHVPAGWEWNPPPGKDQRESGWLRSEIGVYVDRRGGRYVVYAKVSPPPHPDADGHIQIGEFESLTAAVAAADAWKVVAAARFAACLAVKEKP